MRPSDIAPRFSLSLRDPLAWLAALGLALVVGLALPGCGGGGGEVTPEQDTADATGTDTADGVGTDDDGADPGGSDPGSGDEGETTTTDDGGPGDTAETADTPDTTVDRPEVDFAFQTAQGLQGLGRAVLALDIDDEPGDYAASPGLQLDVEVQVADIEDGRPVQLFVRDSVVAEGALLLGDDGVARATFTAITLDHSDSGYDVRVVATNGAGVEGSATKQVLVDIGRCAVDVLPSNSACLTEDVDPATDGVQVRLTVFNAAVDCDDASLTVSVDGRDDDVQSASLDADGAAAFTVTVSDDDATDGVPVVVQARVVDADAGDRDGVTNRLSYTSDTTAPVLTITQPATDTLSIPNDLDAGTAGIQVRVAGTATGLPAGAGGTVQLFLNDVAAGTAAVDGDGNFAADAFTFATSGRFVLRAELSDPCGNAGETQRGYDVFATAATLVVLSPQDQGTLLAVNDGDTATPLAYEAEATFFADDVLPGFDARFDCRQNATDSIFVEVGRTTIEAVSEDSNYSLQVALDTARLGNDLLCRVVYEAPLQAVSDVIAVRVALPAPRLELLSPAGDTIIREPRLGVSVAGTGLEGQALTMEVLSEDGDELLSATSAEQFASGGLDTEVLLVITGGAPLPSGSYRLRVDATDAAGNKASDNSASLVEGTFILDTVPPELTIVAPATRSLDPSMDAAAEDANASLPGHQLAVRVRVAGERNPQGTEVCISLNDGAEVCASPADGSDEAIFADVTFVAGANRVTWRATDAAGNATGTRSDTYTLVIDAPRVFVRGSSAGVVTVADSTDLTVQVEDQNGAPATGATLTVLRGAADAGGTVSDDGGGEYTIAGVGLEDGANDLVVRAVLSGREGFSSVWRVMRKTAAPAVALTAPVDGATLNTVAGGCRLQDQDCVTTVTAALTDVEDGSTGVAEVACPAGGAAVATEALADAGVLQFEGVRFVDQQTCSLTVRVTDAAGQEATTDAATVTVDRIAPRVVRLTSPAKASLVFEDDVDPLTVGLQTRFAVEVSGVEAGQTVRLEIESADTVTPIDLPVTTAIADDATAVLRSAIVTVPDGLLFVRVTVDDAQGNPSNTLSTVLDVRAQAADVRFRFPAALAETACSTDADCPNAATLCEEGHCVYFWSASSAPLIFIETQGISRSPNNLVVCSSAAGLTTDPCQTTGYRQVASATVGTSAEQSVDLSSAPEGLHELIVEVRASETGAWATSLQSAETDDRSRDLLIDRTAPVVAALTSESDANGDDWHNLAEQSAGPGTYDVRVRSDSAGGRARVFANGTQQATGALGDDGLVSTVTLREGSNDVRAVVTDRVGNSSVAIANPAATSLLVRVDSVAPRVIFQQPAASPVLVGEDRDVVVRGSDATSGVVGQRVTLFDDGAQIGQPVQVNESGSARFLFDVVPVLTDGTHRLTATITDVAGNQGQGATTPAEVIVDTVAPTLDLRAPTSPSLFGDADDAQPAVGGYQVRVDAGTTGAATYEIALRSNCDLSFTGCDADAVAAIGSVSEAGEASEGFEAFVTVPFSSDASRRGHVMTVTAFDDNGNATAAEVQFQVVVSGCFVSIGNLPALGRIGNANCPTAGSDCDSTDFAARAVLSGECSDVATVKLQRDGADVLAPLAPTDGEAEFALPIADGDTFTLEAIALDGAAAEVAASGPADVAVDLHDPQVALVAQAVGDFMTPAGGGDHTFGLADDTDGDAGNDLQFDLAVSIEDGAGRATIRRVQVDGVESTPTTALPAAVTTLPSVTVVSGNTLSHGNDQLIEVVVTDPTGNEARASFTAHVDLIAPSAPSLADLMPDDVDRRMPSLTLRFDHASDDDDGVDPVVSYDVRFSKSVITSAEEFDQACMAAMLRNSDEALAPAAPGEPATWTLSGPDTRDPSAAGDCFFATSGSATTWHVAVRAIDDAGNASAITMPSASTLSTDDIVYRSVRVRGDNLDDAGLFHLYAFGLGDVDGDGMGDFATGGRANSQFCVVFGRTLEAAAENIVPNGGDADSTCLSGDIAGNLGAMTANVGDFSQDGVTDIAVGLGNPNFESLGDLPAREVRIYGVDPDLRIAETPDLVFRGMTSTTSGLRHISSADFNGDGIPDLVVGSPAENRAYVIPGRLADAWPAPADDGDGQPKTYYDLKLAADAAALDLITIELTDADPGAGFGRTVAGVGNAIVDDGEPQYDDIAIMLSASPSVVVVVRGRALAGETVLSITEDVTEATGDNANTVRLTDGSATAQFGRFISAGDVTGDGVPDILIDHAAALPSRPGTLFYGHRLAAALGTTLGLGLTDASPVFGGVRRGDNGVLFTGELAGFILTPPLDDVMSDAATMDVMVAFLSSTVAAAAGEVFIRHNVVDDDAGIALGTFPYASVSLVDPDGSGRQSFGLTGGVGGPQPVGDFNGDGFNDFVVPVRDAAGQVLFY